MKDKVISIQSRMSVVLLMLLCSIVSMQAQEFTIDAVEQNPFDLTANHSPRADFNGVNCAVVKVKVPLEGCTFEGNYIGDIEHSGGEYILYLIDDTKKFKIKHNRLKEKEIVFSDWGIASLVSERTYEVMASVPQYLLQSVASVAQPDRIQTGYLVINSQPEGAHVYLTEDGIENFSGTTPFYKKLSYGSYSYRLKKSLYHDELGTAVIDKDRVVKDLTLRPAFGSLKVTSNPTGAIVTIENDSREFTAPCTIEQLASGKYNVNIIAPRYAAVTRNVEVTDGKTTNLDVALDARFARVDIKSLPGAKITINGQVKDHGSYSEELGEGIYDIEVSLANHRTITRQIEVVAKQPQSLTIEPMPIYGSLDIVSQPMFAQVAINGKSYGDTPMSIDNLLIGNYEVTLSKEGCATVSKQVTITENTLSTVDVTLPQGREMTIRSDASGDEVHVDGVKMGFTPLTTNLSFGTHSIELRRAGKTVSTSVDVTTYGSEKEIVITFGLQPKWGAGVTASQKKILQKLIDDMVSVEGGSFTMGATSEQGNDADDDEKPTHQVTLNDFMIGKTEVTQEVWRAVMGSNPSYYKGDNLPVEQVSWNDCQEFIKKLNKMTGLNFRLPTEAEWEYAARGGNKSRGYKYSGSNTIAEVAWYTETTNDSGTKSVGTKSANELGLYDMSGNVYEWCQDWYGDYSSGSQTNPEGPSTGSDRVLRGGSWSSHARGCRLSYRFYYNPDYGYDFSGVRVCLGRVL